MRRPLSLAVITLNESANLERCLKSVPMADDIVILDSGSTDGTRELAKSLGARVFNEEWRGFRAHKQRATDLCKNDWVLSLDADEALSPEAQNELKALLSGDADKFDGYEFPRLTWNLGRWIRYGGWYPDLQLRLFNRTRASWGGGEHVHERVEAVHVQRLASPILHWAFRDHAHQVATNNRYSGLGALELQRRGKKFSLLRLIFKPISKFLETYVVKRGFLDGLPGFIIAVGAAYSVFLKFAKLWELENRESIETSRNRTL
jgi:glycosyltransferase involved in cell wall biosynthesis